MKAKGYNPVSFFFLAATFLALITFACNISEQESKISMNCVVSDWDGGSAFPALSQEGRFFIDEYGRTVMLRGVNAGGRAKMPPHLPWEGSDFGDPSFEDDLNRFYDFMKDWGINVIRLPVFWESIEPVRGSCSETYRNKIEAQIEAAEDRNIYVFIDFHQDLYSRILGGSGAPAWALSDPETEPVPLDNHNWFARYLKDPEILASFERFWSNADGVQDDYISMAVQFMSYFADHPNVIGVDLMNEPAPGETGHDDYQDWFENSLKPFYERLGTAIHETEPDLILFVEPTGLEAVGSDLGGTLPRPELNNLVFAPHYYNPKQFSTGEYDGDSSVMLEGLSLWDSIGEEFDSPVLLGEFGFCAGRIEGDPSWYLSDHYQIMDRLFMHGTIWSHDVSSVLWNDEDCSLMNQDWTERTTYTDEVSRPFPKFTSGTWISFSYDSDSHSIEYSYLTASTTGAPTVIALPERHYPDEPHVSLAFGAWEYHADKRELHIFDKTCPGKTQVVKISPYSR